MCSSFSFLSASGDVNLSLESVFWVRKKKGGLFYVERVLFSFLCGKIGGCNLFHFVVDSYSYESRGGKNPRSWFNPWMLAGKTFYCTSAVQVIMCLSAIRFEEEGNLSQLVLIIATTCSSTCSCHSERTREIHLFLAMEMFHFSMLFQPNKTSHRVKLMCRP